MKINRFTIVECAWYVWYCNDDEIVTIMKTIINESFSVVIRRSVMVLAWELQAERACYTISLNYCFKIFPVFQWSSMLSTVVEITRGVQSRSFISFIFATGVCGLWHPFMKTIKIRADRFIFYTRAFFFFFTQTLKLYFTHTYCWIYNF